MHTQSPISGHFTGMAPYPSNKEGDKDDTQEKSEPNIFYDSENEINDLNLQELSLNEDVKVKGKFLNGLPTGFFEVHLKNGEIKQGYFSSSRKFVNQNQIPIDSVKVSSLENTKETSKESENSITSTPFHPSHQRMRLSKNIEIEGEIVNNLPIGNCKIFFEDGSSDYARFGLSRKLPKNQNN